MSLNIELRDHPNRYQVKAPDGRGLFHCGKCKDDTVEPHNHPAHRPVVCDTCGGTCEPRMEITIKNQHGVYFDGKLVGYALKEKGGWLSTFDKVDDYVFGEIVKVYAKQYGEPSRLQNGAYVPEELVARYWKTAGMEEKPYEPENDPELKDEEVVE